MNMFKKLAITVAFLCAATVATAQENGMKIGARVGYSMQNVGYGTGMLGFGGGFVFDIPVGPISFNPEVAILYRNNFDEQTNETGKLTDLSQPELAVSIPIMIKFLSFLAVGVQVDIPINPEVCYDSKCESMDGKKVPYERASYDLSVILDGIYRITSSLNIDLRTTWGVTPHHTVNSSIGKINSNKMHTFGFGVSYFFL
jgi:hypothetical protein